MYYLCEVIIHKINIFLLSKRAVPYTEATPGVSTDDQLMATDGWDDEKKDLYAGVERDKEL